MIIKPKSKPNRSQLIFYIIYITLQADNKYFDGHTCRMGTGAAAGTGSGCLAATGTAGVGCRENGDGVGRAGAGAGAA